MAGSGSDFRARSPALLRKVEKGKPLTGHFEDKACIVEGEAFGNTGFGQAVVAYLFDVHVYLIPSLI